MTDRELVDRLVREVELDDSPFTTWEMDFIESMSERVGFGQLLTPNQRGKLEQIHAERVDGAVR